MRKALILLVMLLIGSVPHIQAKKKLFNPGEVIPGLTIVYKSKSNFKPLCMYFENSADTKLPEETSLPDQHASMPQYSQQRRYEEERQYRLSLLAQNSAAQERLEQKRAAQERLAQQRAALERAFAQNRDSAHDIDAKAHEIKQVKFKGEYLPNPYWIICQSYADIEYRVLESNRRYRREKAKYMVLGKHDLKENFNMQNKVLASNYVLVISDGGGKYLWRLYRIDVPEDAAQLLELNGGNVSELDLKYEFVSNGKLKKSWDWDKRHDKFAKQCPELAVVAPVVKVKSHNSATRMGRKDLAFSEGDRFVGYTTKYNEKKDIFYSTKVGVFRAVHVSPGSMRDTGRDSTLYFQIAGKRLRPGDVMVYSPDKRKSTAISATAQKGIYGFRLDFDMMHHISRMGFATYSMVSAGFKMPSKPFENWYKREVDTYEVEVDSDDDKGKSYYKPGEDKRTKTVHYYTGNVVNINSVLIPWVSYGFGGSFNFWHSLELRPYFSVGFELPIITDGNSSEDGIPPTPDMNIFRGDEKNLEADSYRSFGFNVVGTLGCRFTLNICYPFQLMAAAEYNYRFMSPVPKALQNEVLSPMGIKMGTGFSAYAGFRWCF